MKVKIINTERYKTEEEKLEVLENNGFNIKYIKNPSEALQLVAVKENGEALEYINNPTEAVIEYCLENSIKIPSYIEYEIIENKYIYIMKIADEDASVSFEILKDNDDDIIEEFRSQYTIFDWKDKVEFLKHLDNIELKIKQLKNKIKG